MVSSFALHVLLAESEAQAANQQPCELSQKKTGSGYLKHECPNTMSCTQTLTTLDLWIHNMPCGAAVNCTIQ